MRSIFSNQSLLGHIKIGFFLVLFYCGATNSISAQGTPESDTSGIKETDIHFSHSHRRGNTTTFFFGLSVGINGYMNHGNLNLPSELDDLELSYGHSWEVSWHIIQQKINLYKDRIRLFYGPELSFQRYRFVNHVTLVPGQSELTITRDDLVYKRNKLRTVFLTMPVLLEFKTKPGKFGNTFRFGAGATGGILLGAKQKQKSTEFGVQKVKDDFNLNKFRLGLRGQIGYGQVGLYVNYGITKFFKDGQGPELNPITFGFVFFFLT